MVWPMPQVEREPDGPRAEWRDRTCNEGRGDSHDRFSCSDLQARAAGGNAAGFMGRKAAASSSANSDPGATTRPTADSAGMLEKAISPKPSTVVARHVSVTSTTPNQPNLMVYFGTGQYIATGDTTSTATQTFYGVWDRGTSELLRAKLTPQTITTTATRTLSNTAVAYTASGGAQKFGWYIDLHTSNAATGERVVVDSLVRGNEVYFNTLIPNNVPCSFGGSGWSMRVNRDNGGLPAAPVFDTDGNGIVNGSDNINVTGELVSDAIMTESKILGNTAYISTSDGKIVQKKVTKIKSAEAGRQSWREIIK